MKINPFKKNPQSTSDADMYMSDDPAVPTGPVGPVDVPPPEGSVPDPYTPNRFIYGGKGGGDTKDGVTIVDVYDQNGQKLGTDSTYYKNDKAYHYGVDFGDSKATLDSNGFFVAPSTGGTPVTPGSLPAESPPLGSTAPTGGTPDPTYSAFPTSGNDPTYSGFPPGVPLPAGVPAGATPDPANPDHYIYGGKGGGDEQNGYGETSVYDNKGNLLGSNKTFYLNGQKYNYGVDYGNSSPNLDSQGHFIAPDGSVSDYGVGTPTGASTGTPTYAAFPTTGTYAAFPGTVSSGTVALTPGQIAAGMGDGDNPLHGGGPAASGISGTTYAAFPPGSATPAWGEAHIDAIPSADKIGSSLEPHGMGMMMRDSKDGQKEIVQMTDGTYQSVDKTTGQVASAGTWGDGHGGGVAQNGVGLSSVGLPDNGGPASTPATADFHPPTAATATFKSDDMFATAPPPASAVIGATSTVLPSTANDFNSTTPATATFKSDDMAAQAPAVIPVATTAPTADFHPPSAATAAAKSDDMFASAPAAPHPTLAATPPPPPAPVAASLPPPTDAIDRFMANHSAAPAPVVKPKLTLPPASPHDLPLGGGFGGLDPSSGAHKYLGRH